MAVKSKNFNENSGEFVLGESNTNSTELSLLKFLLLTYYHSHFLAATLDFPPFFTMACLGGTHFFTAILFLG